MSYPVAESKISRRTFTRICAASFAIAPFRAAACSSHTQAAGAFLISLELKGPSELDGPLTFVIRVANPANAPAPLTSIQLFAPGDSTPGKARFDVAGSDVRSIYSGQLHLEPGQTVMALAELADGTLVHDRRHVRPASV